MLRHGWTLLFHECLVEQVRKLKAAADRAESADPSGFEANANVKLFRALRHLILVLRSSVGVEALLFHPVVPSGVLGHPLGKPVARVDVDLPPRRGSPAPSWPTSGWRTSDRRSASPCRASSVHRSNPSGIRLIQSFTSWARRQASFSLTERLLGERRVRPSPPGDPKLSAPRQSAFWSLSSRRCPPSTAPNCVSIHTKASGEVWQVGCPPILRASGRCVAIEADYPMGS
jgi:hypothetical protein